MSQALNHATDTPPEHTPAPDSQEVSDHCLDCGHTIAPEDRYCSACGQPTRLHPPTLWEFIHEWVLHYLALEGKLWKSLWALMVRPGFLTLEYLQGRRQRYVQPLRLTLTLGLLFFLTIQLGPSVDTTVVAQGQSEEADLAEVPKVGISVPDSLRSRLPQRLQENIEAANARAQQNPEGELRRIGKAMLGMAPYAVLVSLPFFAGLLKLLFWSMPFGAHFVFALHLHAAWYGSLLLVALLPWLWAAAAVWIWAQLYPVLALRRVHQIGWGRALGKSLVLAVLHLMLILCGLVSLAMLGASIG